MGTGSLLYSFAKLYVFHPLKRQSRLQQTTFINIFHCFSEKTRFDVSSESSARQKTQMKNQALFSTKDKSKQLKCRLLQFLFGALRVNMFQVPYCNLSCLFQKYLEQFGYLDDSEEGVQHSEDSRRQAIRYMFALQSLEYEHVQMFYMTLHIASVLLQIWGGW